MVVSLERMNHFLCDTGHYGGGMGEESSSSGGELEAGELVIDDSYTHLSKKKKKSKKSKKKKDKEKDRDKEKSGKDKKHSKSFGGMLSFFFIYVYIKMHLQASFCLI